LYSRRALALAAGSRLGPYEILSPLGAGGMGEVYRAKDTRLQREVAVKVLPEATSQDPESLARFERETRAVAALSHPNILAIHDVGREGDVRFAVLELLDGETLRHRLANGPLVWREALAVSAAVAHGLAAAHAKGIVHRDLKPENIFLTADGRVKILDFGLARSFRASGGSDGSRTPTENAMTAAGVILGTMAYLSPEQARGETVDGRSDVFSFGCVLYEMLTGRQAFQGSTTAELLVAILRDDPPEPKELGVDCPPELLRVLLRCLRKSSAVRFQSASDLAFALESLGASAEESRLHSAPGRDRPRRSIAVLLFKDLAGDPANAHLGLGLADATITELATVKSLIVRPTASILRYRDRPIGPEEAGRELDVDAVVDGSFQRSGSRLRVTVQLIDSAEGRPLWGAKIDTSLDDLFGMQDQVSRKIAEALEVELSPSAQRVGRVAPAPGKAYELYMMGRLELSSDTTLPKVNAAIECFEGALKLAPGFALAQLGLADAYARMDFSLDPEGGWFARAEEMCDKTLAASPDLPEGRYLRGRLLWHPRNNWDDAGAMREFSAAIGGRPSLHEAHHFLGQLLNHLGLLDEAVRCFDRALDIEPEDHYAQIHRALALYFQGRFAEALAVTTPATARLPSSWNLYQIALCQLHLGRARDAAVTVEGLARQFPGNVLLFSLRGLAAAMEGDAGRAREQIELVVRNRKLFGHYHHAQYDVACIEAFTGEEDSAIGWLTEAAHNGFPCVPFFETDPWLEPLRGREGFQSLLADLRVSHEQHGRLYRELSATNP
jgi:serine/threonine protein kinase/tetratricopeptide (TPR) repeat protein